MNILAIKLKNSKIGIICIAVISISIISFSLAYFINPKEWSWASLLLNIGVALLQLFLALLIVNVYLSNTEKQKVNLAVLIEIDDAVSQFHNHFIDSMIKKFGQKNFLTLMEELSTSNFKTTNLSEEIRNKIIDTIGKEYNSLLEEGYRCVGKIDQTIKTGIFSSIPDALSYATVARKKMDTIVGLNIKNPNDHISLIENFFAFDWAMHLMRMELAKRGGIDVEVKKKQKANRTVQSIIE